MPTTYKSKLAEATGLIYNVVMVACADYINPLGFKG